MGMSAKTVLRPVYGYFIHTGVALHLLLAAIYFFTPFFSGSVVQRSQEWLVSKGLFEITANRGSVNHNETKEEIEKVFGKWTPIDNGENEKFIARIGNQKFSSIKQALATLDDGEILEIGEGLLHEPFVITRNNIKIVGVGHVIIEDAVAEGKAAIVNRGNDNSIENIECRYIEVPHQNGACVRHEGVNLTLNHVYFHDSETGLLSGNKSGKITIMDSRFELLGKKGAAHGVYVGSGELEILGSLFIASKSEGHEVKSRAEKTTIRNSVIASMSAKDSRLIDISNGGMLTVENSILQQGEGSSNQDAIGYGLEGYKFPTNALVLKDNLVILERDGNNVFIHTRGNNVKPVLRNNIIVSKDEITMSGMNFQFENRKEAGLESYPMLPLSRINGSTKGQTNNDNL